MFKLLSSDHCWTSYTCIQNHTILFAAWWTTVLSCNNSGFHDSDYTGCCLLGYDVIYKCTSESQKSAASFNHTRKMAKSSLYFYQTKLHHIPQDSHYDILGEDYTKLSEFLNELLTVCVSTLKTVTTYIFSTVYATWINYLRDQKMEKLMEYCEDGLINRPSISDVHIRIQNWAFF